MKMKATKKFNFSQPKNSTTSKNNLETSVIKDTVQICVPLLNIISQFIILNKSF